jgi:predicted phage terminase large subunit-like protein
MEEKTLRKSRESLLNFVQTTFPGYQVGWFHRKLASELDQFLVDVKDQKSPRLIIMAPPRHGKSELSTVRLVAYALGKYPDMEIITTANTADLAGQFSRDVQSVLDTEKYHSIFPETRIVGRFAGAGEAIRQSGFFEIVGRRGKYRSCGVGGAITGMGADILIIDDPVKDDKEANSPLQRDNLWNWFRSTARTRLSPGGGIIVCMTRWHMDDLVGRLLKQEQEGGEHWGVLSFPAIAEEDDDYRRKGEPLCPERFSIADLLNTQRLLGSYRFQALYQQHPIAPEGGIVKMEWLRYYTESDLPQNFDQILISCDCSFKDTPGSDFVAIHVWGKAGAKFYLLDRDHGRMNFTATCTAIAAMTRKWPKAMPILIEDAANGPAVVDELSRHISGVVSVRPEGSKESRVNAVSALFEAGDILLPHPRLAPWVSAVANEFTGFPHVPHDDDTDAMTQALRRFRSCIPLAIHFSSRPIPGLRDGILSSQALLPAITDREKVAYAKIIQEEPLTGEDEDAILFDAVLNDFEERTYGPHTVTYDRIEAEERDM